MGESGTTLEAQRVTKGYGNLTALDGVTLKVAAGERVALVGESGSGKSTLLRLFNRMVEPEAGRVLVGGAEVCHMDPVKVRRSLGYVQQEGGLLPHWTVLRNVALVPRLRQLPDAEERARSSLRQVGLPPEDFAGRWPRELSGGQRQRVALARAVASDPAAILLDEPFGALDAITKADVIEGFATTVIDSGITVLLVTHDLREGWRLADRVAVMRAGRIEQIAPPGELVARPATDYVAELLRKAGVE